jgi:glycine oxidase
MTPGAAAEDFEIQAGRVRAVRTSRGSLSADQFCLTAGSWTAALARRLDVSLAIRPIRGQMVLLSAAGPTLAHIVNEGSRYLVPRGDGRVLAGSTEEDVGFDRSTTAGGVSGLLDFALGLVPALAEAKVERSWAGLRPATADDRPYLGRVPTIDNAFVAAGHFRSGLQLSTATAVVMSQLMRGEATDVDLTAFRVERGSAADRSDSPERPRRRELPVR